MFEKLKIWDCPFGREHKTKPCVLVEDLLKELQTEHKEKTFKIMKESDKKVQLLDLGNYEIIDKLIQRLKQGEAKSNE